MSGTHEQTALRELSFRHAFTRQVARSGPFSRRTMLAGCGAAAALAVLGLWLQVIVGVDWRPMTWLVVNPVALVVILRSWAYERWGRFAGAVLVAVASSIAPWIIGGEWGELPL